MQKVCAANCFRGKTLTGEKNKWYEFGYECGVKSYISFLCF